jgi:cell wall-associated NlpC family hydrolase
MNPKISVMLLAMHWLIIFSLSSVLTIPAWAFPAEENSARGLTERSLASQIGGQLNHVRDKASDQATGMVEQAMKLLGVPYRRGGTSEVTGFDCSGFVRHLYEKSLGQILPRRAVDQARATEVIAREELQPGDLVFFNTMRRAFSHVGIYVGDGKFIHAPRTGKSVDISDMRSAYWQKRFNGARRVPVNSDNAKHENPN